MFWIPSLRCLKRWYIYITCNSWRFPAYVFVLGLISLMCRTIKKTIGIFSWYAMGKQNMTKFTKAVFFLVSLSVEPQLDDANDDAYAVYTAIRRMCQVMNSKNWRDSILWWRWLTLEVLAETLWVNLNSPRWLKISWKRPDTCYSLKTLTIIDSQIWLQGIVQQIVDWTTKHHQSHNDKSLRQMQSDPHKQYAADWM